MYYYNSNSIDNLFDKLFASLGILFIIILAIAIVQTIGMWKLFKKAGKPGWGSLIPIYNNYLLCKIAGINPWWVLIMILSPVLSFIPILGPLVVIAISIYYLVLLNVSLAHSFGKESIFAVGLILLQPIFYCILGFDSSKYIGPTPMNDFIFSRLNNSDWQNNPTENVNSNPNYNQVNTVNQNSNLNNQVNPINQNSNLNNQNATNNMQENGNLRPKYCSNCGNQIGESTMYCPKCGNKIN